MLKQLGRMLPIGVNSRLGIPPANERNITAKIEGDVKQAKHTDKAVLKMRLALVLTVFALVFSAQADGTGDSSLPLPKTISACSLYNVFKMIFVLFSIFKLIFKNNRVPNLVLFLLGPCFEPNANEPKAKKNSLCDALLSLLSLLSPLLGWIFATYHSFIHTIYQTLGKR